MNPSADLDVVVLGGGPAGSAAAIELAQAGRRVALLERTLHAHDKVCGDFLSVEAISSLNALGLTPADFGAVPIERVRLAGSLGVSSARLPFAAQSLTRRTLDDALLNRASAAGALVLRGHSAESVYRDGSLWHVAIAGPNRSYSLTAPEIVLATGKHDLRGLPRPAGVQANLVGLKMYLRLTAAQSAALDGNIELVLLPGGYGGLTLVEKRIANLCFVLDRDLLRDASRDWAGLLELLTRAPHLGRRLAGAQPVLSRPLAISPVPYGFVRRDAIAEGIFAVGDQAAVIPSFTGDGLAIAVHTGRLAARAVLAGRSAQMFHLEQHAQLRSQIALSTMLSRAMVNRPRRAVLELAISLFPGLLSSMATRSRIRPKYQLPAHTLPAVHEKSCAAA